jgi:hypothetical protein
MGFQPAREAFILSKVLLVGALGALITSAATGIFVLLQGEFGETQRDLLLSTLVVAGFSLTGLASTVGLGSWWTWPARPLGLASSAVGLGLVLLLIWGVADSDDQNLKLAGTLAVVAVSSAQLSLLGALRPAHRVVLAWSLGATLAGLLLAYLIVGAIWGHMQPDSEQTYLRWVGVVAILDLTGAIGLYPLSRLMKGTRSAAPRRARPQLRRLRPSRARR